jgi:hypothetical protein
MNALSSDGTLDSIHCGARRRLSDFGMMKLCCGFARHVKVSVQAVGCVGRLATLHGVVFDIFLRAGIRRDSAPGPKAHRPFQAVAQIAGFGPEKSKMVNLSMGID